MRVTVVEYDGSQQSRWVIAGASRFGCVENNLVPFSAIGDEDVYCGQITVFHCLDSPVTLSVSTGG